MSGRQRTAGAPLTAQSRPDDGAVTARLRDKEEPSRPTATHSVVSDRARSARRGHESRAGHGHGSSLLRPWLLGPGELPDWAADPAWRSLSRASRARTGSLGRHGSRTGPGRKSGRAGPGRTGTEVGPGRVEPRGMDGPPPPPPLRAVLTEERCRYRRRHRTGGQLGAVIDPLLAAAGPLPSDSPAQARATHVPRPIGSTQLQGVVRSASMA